MLKATIPGKIRVPVKGHAIPNYRGNSITIAIKPVATIWLDNPPEHDERCCIVWSNGRRLVKFISKACPHHNKVECLTELAN